ncbi:MAG TPA: D-alanyl-D-alanine carboxypeptidase/D-alanyl-D-alanine-endopeptidase [Gaiellaceae bacterium]|nr:D-alanyl-D-alanine carboxypeptidase/D-alanyl-D-alanine-endopeptidase [Gaiellaceae bacterium]
MRKRGLALAVLVIALVAAQPSGAAAQTPLARQLAKALHVPHVSPAQSGAVAVDLATGRLVFAHNLTRPLIPASNEKLAVTFAALHVFGPAHRFDTTVLGEGEQEGAIWRGDIVLKGFGDPTLSTLNLHALAGQLRVQGITRVSGRLVGDESYFDARRTAPGWKPWFFINESPPLSALTVDRARYHGRTARDPALAAALSFREALRAAGISVAGRSLTGRAADDAFPLASVSSVPLAAILRFMNRESDNFTAEILLKQLGTQLSDQGTTAAGSAVVRSILAEQQIPIGGVRIVDGSGLSGLNRLTANMLVGLLQDGYDDPGLREVLFSSLPVAGRNGTLRRRMRGSAAAGRVMAKTGTTREASALSGYVKRRYAFAILQNGHPVSTLWARRAQDRFAAVLAAN